MEATTMILAALAAIILLDLALEDVFRRTGIPDVLVLLVLGLVASQLLEIDTTLLDLVGPIFVEAALVFLLFEGGLHIGITELNRASRPAVMLCVVGFVMTVGLVGLAAKQLFQLRTIPALMLGAMVGGTSPAVALPLIKSLRLGDTARAIVVLETAITDVLAIVVTEALLELILAERAHPLSPLVALLREFFGATLFGLLAGYGWAHVQRRVPSWGGSMVATGAAAFLFASLAEAIHLPSPIAALAFGIALGNLRLPSRDTLVTEFEPVVPAEERHILANLAFIFKAYFFVYLGLSLRLSGWEPFVFGGLVTLLIFLLRPFVIRWVIPAHMLPRSQASIVAMLGAKGLASAILASLPVKAGLPEGELLRSVVLGVVLLSITLTSLLVLGRRSRLVVRGYDRMLAPFAPAESPP